MQLLRQIQAKDARSSLCYTEKQRFLVIFVFKYFNFLFRYELGTRNALSRRGHVPQPVPFGRLSERRVGDAGFSERCFSAFHFWLRLWHLSGILAADAVWCWIQAFVSFIRNALSASDRLRVSCQG